AALFMLLLAPMGTDLPLPVPDDDLIVVDIREPIEPPTPPPVRAPVTPPAPTPPVVRQPRGEPVAPAPVAVEQAGPLDLPLAPPADATPAGPVATSIAAAPITGVRLEYAAAPPPAYPRRQLADRI